MKAPHAPLITLTTDFGESSHYVAQMKGVVLGICPQATLVDITHRVAPQQIEQAAWILQQTHAAFPAGTCHLAVVDPGVGTERAILLVAAADQYFIAPDNGLLWPIIDRHAPAFIRRLENPRFWRSERSHTFHGRDIMAPVAAHLLAGVNPAEFGPGTSQVERLDLPVVTIDGPRVSGQVVLIDAYGNLITNIAVADLGPGAPRHVELPQQSAKIGDWVTAYARRTSGSAVSLTGSTGHLEIAVVNGSAAQRFGAAAGDPVVVCWQPFAQLGCGAATPYNDGHDRKASTKTVVGGSSDLAGKIQGKVVSISDRGDAITDIAVDRLHGIPTDESVSIHCEGHATSCIFPADHDQPEMTFLAVQGTSGFLELSLVGDSVKAFLGIGPGSQVMIKW
jgi:S-adenosylmethionine hydrolase